MAVALIAAIALALTTSVLASPILPSQDTGAAIGTDITIEPDSIVIMNALPEVEFPQTTTVHVPAEFVDSGYLRVLFLFDTSASMGPALSSMVDQSIELMNELALMFPNARFAAASHSDYSVEVDDMCDYSGTYSTSGEDPYVVHTGLDTAGRTAPILRAIAEAPLADDGDEAEGYTRALTEAYSSGILGHGINRTRLVIHWGDSVQHDCAVDACLGGSRSTGPDPGRNGVAGDGDDLEILEVLDWLNKLRIPLIAMHAGSEGDLWDCYASRTGGFAVQLGTDGIPVEDIDLVSWIAPRAEQAPTSLQQLGLFACSPEFESWLHSVAPRRYWNITRDVDKTFVYEVVFSVPRGTRRGIYQFELCVNNRFPLDPLARQQVTITVPPPVSVHEANWGEIKARYR